MAYYSAQIDKYLEDTRNGLLLWENFELTAKFVFKYIEEIKFQCETIEQKSIHFKTAYYIHKQYGENVHVYRRNSNTSWYIIYIIDTFGSIFINKIIFDYTTTE